MLCKLYFMSFILCSVKCFFFSLLLFSFDKSFFTEFNVVSLNSVSFTMTILIDWMSMLFLSFVFFISAVVINYSDEYMSSDKSKNRFVLLVVLFVLSMVLLIISPNLVSILLGWDGLGLVSYVLVIYYQNVKSFNAGMLTVLTNRIGDVALLMSIAWMMNYGSWSYIFYLDFMKNDNFMNFIGCFIIIASMTKSAQIPFSSWLPAAMAAPTPVSSLVHSSTLVTAGVYLLIRFYEVFSLSMLNILLYFSLLTMFMSGLGANFEFDLKKIIALSTLSQLGLMISILCLGSLNLAFFHLLTHALFKALLFMCAGVIIHNLSNCQDIRYMGSLIFFMPLTCSFMNICNFSLCGLPFLSGFYSKDLIVEVMSMGYLNFFVYIIFYLSIGLTVCYSFRLIYYSMVGNFCFLSFNCLEEKYDIMLKSMTGLLIFVIFSGSMLMWMMFPSPYFICLPFYMKVLTLILVFLGILIGMEMNSFNMNCYLMNLKFLKLFSFSMWNLVYLSTLGVSFYPLILGNIFYKKFDQGWFEYYGSQNLFESLKYISQLFQFLSKNHLKIYFSLILFWLVFLFLFIN
uniref:NADH dehydrogenase subunit 5 n=1 Tax=Lissorhoptrus oryzophilus TaxID=308863 RepID=UPI001BEE7536|nr:NADH dehydrogenase subunit 5 [Lissorhoptrus oryzophilus]QUA05796.1 NADH dehydrogenase subunit 5 [Lissorhoptrus oryzophilus]